MGHLTRGERRRRPTPRRAPRPAKRDSIPRWQPSSKAKADTLFKGETLRSILLNAYGWWTAATIAVYAGYILIAVGLVFGVLGLLGFRHARRAADAEVVTTMPADRVPATV